MFFTTDRINSFMAGNSSLFGLFRSFAMKPRGTMVTKENRAMIAPVANHPISGYTRCTIVPTNSGPTAVSIRPLAIIRLRSSRLSVMAVVTEK